MATPLSESIKQQDLTIYTRRIRASHFGQWEANVQVGFWPENPLFMETVGMAPREAAETLKTQLRLLGFVGEIEVA